MRQCGPVVRTLALRSRDPGFKTRSEEPGKTLDLLSTSKIKELSAFKRQFQKDKADKIKVLTGH